MRWILCLIRTLLWPVGILLHRVLHRREARSSPELQAEIAKLNALVQKGELTPEEWHEAVERLSRSPTEGKLPGLILWPIGILLAPAIILVRWLQSRREPRLSEEHLLERANELVGRSRRGELTLPELYEALGRPVGNLPRKGEVTARELCEALGWPLNRVPRELWDNKVPIPMDGQLKVGVLVVRRVVPGESLVAKAKATLSRILAFGVVIYNGARRWFKRG